MFQKWFYFIISYVKCYASYDRKYYFDYHAIPIASVALIEN